MILQAIFIHSYFTPHETQNEIQKLYAHKQIYNHHQLIIWAYYIEAKLQHYMIMMDIVSRKGVEKAKLTMRYTLLILITYIRVVFSFLRWRRRLFVVSYWYLAYAPWVIQCNIMAVWGKAIRITIQILRSYRNII